jgi:glycosyltransferase involved in cell wall biosynthesis
MTYMKQSILLSAFACDPTRGSEPGNGWNWAIGLANKGFEVHCLTRVVGIPGIEKQEKPDNLYFHFVALPIGLERLYKFSTAGMYLYYLLWQWVAYKKARQLKKHNEFTVAHHVTWGSLQMGSFMYKLGVPFIFGPAGGGQSAPIPFKEYFLNHWSAENKREVLSSLLLRFNPGCRNMLRKAKVVLVSNPQTFDMARSMGTENVHLSLDAALPETFFPSGRIEKSPKDGKLKLLWTGRFMPRKGILLLLDVMRELVNHPDITLSVVGDGEMRNIFLDRIKEYGLENTVFWKGAVNHEEVKEYYRSHDVFFFTSLRDSCPAQLLEAMAFSMPVITLNLHGQAFIVNDETGIRADATSPQIAIKELKEAILKFYSKPELIKQMGAHAFEFASNQKWKVKINTIVEQYYPKA